MSKSNVFTDQMFRSVLLQEYFRKGISIDTIDSFFDALDASR